MTTVITATKETNYELSENKLTDNMIGSQLVEICGLLNQSHTRKA